ERRSRAFRQWTINRRRRVIGDVMANMEESEIHSEMARLNVTPMHNRVSPNPSQIKTWEDALSITVPSDYPDFLLSYSLYDVQAECNCKTLPGTYIEYFYGFPAETDRSLKDLEFDDLALTPDAISIGRDMFGGQFLLFLRGAAKGRIYFCDVEGGGGDILDDPDWMDGGLTFDDLPKYDDETEKPDAFQNLHFIAADFMEFLRMLQPLEQDAP
ncbi:SMI1/KNR4 family protein, partial [Roseiconus lacunae]